MKTKLTLIAVIMPLVTLFIYVALRSGPLAPIAVVTTHVTSGTLQPQTSGIGVIEAKQLHKIGATMTARIEQIMVDAGDQVTAGQVLVTLDPVDIDAKLAAQQALLAKTELTIKEAQLRVNFAQTQWKRYTQLLAAKATQEEQLAIKQQELLLAESSKRLLGAELEKVKADIRALTESKRQLTIHSPISGKVAARLAETGNTALPGQTLIELFNPNDLWISARFDQVNAKGLRKELDAQIIPRSSSEVLTGSVVRLEPKADAVTEELLAKISIQPQSDQLRIGELVTVKVKQAAKTVSLMIPNAALVRHNNQLGVWKIENDEPIFAPIQLGQTDLSGQVEVVSGLTTHDEIVTHSERLLSHQSRIFRVADLVHSTQESAP